MPSWARLNQMSACRLATGRYSPECTLITLLVGFIAACCIASWILSPGYTWYPSGCSTAAGLAVARVSIAINNFGNHPLSICEETFSRMHLPSTITLTPSVHLGAHSREVLFVDGAT